MSLDVGSALRYGFDRLFERNGLLLVALFALVGLLGAVAGQTLTQVLFDWMAQQPWYQDAVAEVGEGPLLPDSAGPLAVSDSPVVAGVLLLVSMLVSEAVRVVSDRTFVSDETETLYQPGRNLAPATVYGLIAGLIALAATAIGLALLVIPGVYIALGLFVFRQEVAVFDKGPVDALVGSWSLTKGNRLSLFLLGLALAVLSFVVDTAAGWAFGPLPALATIVASVVVTAFVAVYASASVAGAYRQLLGMHRPDTEFALDSIADPYGDIDEEWR